MELPPSVRSNQRRKVEEEEEERQVLVSAVASAAGEVSVCIHILLFFTTHTNTRKCVCTQRR